MEYLTEKYSMNLNHGIKLKNIRDSQKMISFILIKLYISLYYNYINNQYLINMIIYLIIKIKHLTASTTVRWAGRKCYVLEPSSHLWVWLMGQTRKLGPLGDLRGLVNVYKKRTGKPPFKKAG